MFPQWQMASMPVWHTLTFGAIYQLTNAHYRGDRVGLYSHGASSGAGHVDADYFRYDYARR